MSQPDYRAAVAAGVKRSAAQCIRRDSPPRPLSAHHPSPHQQHPTQQQPPLSRAQPQPQPQPHPHPHYQQHSRSAHSESHDKKRAVASRPQPQPQPQPPCPSQPRPAQPQQVRPTQQPARVVPHSQPQPQPQLHSQPQNHPHALKQQLPSQQHPPHSQLSAPQPQYPVPRRPTSQSRLMHDDDEQSAPFPPYPFKREEEKEQERDEAIQPLCEAEEGLVSSTLHITHSWADIVQNEHKNNVLAPVTSTSSSRSRHSHSSSVSSASSSRRQPQQHSPLSAAYFASLLPVNKEQQKHIDRQSRHAHDVAHSRDAVISVLSCILEQLFPLKETETLPADVSLITMFHTERVPSISISQYLQRLATYTECSSEVLIQSIIHINRILHHRPSFKINSLNIHRLLLTSLLCSAKFFDDLYYNNAYYAKVGGIGNKELNELEIEFLALINFDLFVEFAVYQHFYVELKSDKLHQHCSCRYKAMPGIDVKAYQLPDECKWEDGEDEALDEEEDAEDELLLDEKCDEEEDEDEEVEEVDTVAAVIETHHTAVVRAGGITTLSPSTTASSSSDDDEEDEDEVEDSEEEDDANDTLLLLAGDKAAMIITEPGTLDRQSSAASTLSVSRSMDSLVVNTSASAAVAFVPVSASAVSVPIITAASIPVAYSAAVPMSDSPILASRNSIKLEARSVIFDITSFPLPPQPAPPAHITYQQIQVAEYYYGHHYVSVEGFHITPHPYHPPPPPPPPPHSYQHAYYQPPPPPPSHPLMAHINGQTHAHPLSHPTSQLHTPILGSVM